MKTAKLTVTIPREDYERIEKEKKRKGLNRSAFISRAIEKFFQTEDEAEKDRRYMEGYKKTPEDIKEIEALLKIQSLTIGDF